MPVEHIAGAGDFHEGKVDKYLLKRGIMPADLAFRQNWATGSVADGMKGLRRDRHRPLSLHH